MKYYVFGKIIQKSISPAGVYSVEKFPLKWQMLLQLAVHIFLDFMAQIRGGIMAMECLVFDTCCTTSRG